MEYGYLISVGLFIAIVIVSMLYTLRHFAQMRYIRQFRFHPALKIKLKQHYPHLSEEQTALVFEGVRDYFVICNQAKRKMVSMPSQAVDVVWHDFILFTRAYGEFCKNAFGRYLHHTPAEAMNSKTDAQEGIKRAWRLACINEKIDPVKPERLPRLFAMDTLLMIENGFVYSLNCQDKTSPLYGDGYCASHIGCSSGCAGDSGGDSDGGGCGGD